MVATATASSFDSQQAASDLRKNQQSARQSSPGALTRLSSYATKNIRGAMLLGALYADNPFGRGSELEDIEGDRIENVGGGDFAADERRYRIAQATRRDVLPDLARRSDEADESESLRAQEAALRAEEAAIMAESRTTPVEEQSRLRGRRTALADRTAQIAANKTKDAAKRALARKGVQAVDTLGGSLAEVTEASTAEVDAGFFSLSDLAWDYARLGVTVLLPIAEDAGNTLSDTAEYTAKKTIHLLIPPYKFIFGGADVFDLGEDIVAVFRLGIMSTIILVLFILAVIIITAIVYSVSYGISFIPGI